MRQAQATRVLRIPKLLSPEECEALVSLAGDIQATNAEATLRFHDDVQLSQRGNWQTTYLHTGGAFGQALPEIYAKLRAAVEEANAAQDWKLLQEEELSSPLLARVGHSHFSLPGGESEAGGCEAGAEPKAAVGADAAPTAGARSGRGADQAKAVRVRTAEVHQVAVGGTLPEPTHYDSGSLITIDVMLSAAGAFDGGTFRTFECNETYLEYPDFNQGDAMVFVSHKYHGGKFTFTGAIMHGCVLRRLRVYTRHSAA